MSKFFSLLLASTVVGAVSRGAETNYVNSGTGPDPDVLSGGYVGTEDNNAADLSNLTGVTVQGATFSGGTGKSVESSGSVESAGGVGLKVRNTGSVVITSPESTFVGGTGGVVANTSGSLSTVASSDGGNALDIVSATASIDGIVATGGAGGDVSAINPSAGSASGGVGASLSVGELFSLNGLFVGGQGGYVSGGGSSAALGGSGVEIVAGTTILTLNDGITARGGDGGELREGVTDADSAGGAGFKILGLTSQTQPLAIDGGEFHGGAGGISESEGSVRADGGAGFDIFQNFLTVSNGSFTGGVGGDASSTSSGSATANGGDGMLANQVVLTVYGGTFSGGAGGVANGEMGNSGAGLRLVDAPLAGNIYGGEFLGLGLVMESSALAGTLNIHGGSFGDMEFKALNGKKNTVNIHGGSFGDSYFYGSAGNKLTATGGDLGAVTLDGTGLNDVRFEGASSFGDLNLLGSSSVISIADGVASSGDVMLSNGSADVNAWNDSNFRNTTVSNGTLNFKSQDFVVLSDGSLVLQDAGAVVNVDQSMTVRSGGRLDVGLGSVEVTAGFTAEDDALIGTVYTDNGAGGVANGVITADAVTLGNDMTWTVMNDGTVSNTSNLADGFLLASAVGGNLTTNDLTSDNFVLAGYNPEWLNDINGVAVTNFGGRDYLHVSYGMVNFERIFSDYPELAPAMGDLYRTIKDDDELLEYINGKWTSIAQAAPDFAEAYNRTPEMASALIGLQSVFADQVKERTRSSLRYRNFGSNTSYAPMGAGGPDWWDNSMDTLNRVLPKWDARGTTRKAGDSVPVPSYSKDSTVAAGSVQGNSRVSYDNMIEELSYASGAPREEIDVPATYQVWGRGYGSHVSQDGDAAHTGYDATIAGGIVGVDKRFENMLLGLGAGYARTLVDGNGGNDGDADTMHVVVYYAANSENAYFDASLNYAFNAVDTESSSDFAYEGEYNASSVAFSLGAGYGFSLFKDQVLLTPEASLLSTYYTREAYTESSDLGFTAKDYESYDQWSHLTSIGLTISSLKKINSYENEMVFEPEFRLHWLHEFNAEMDDDAYSMVGGINDIAVALQAREEDLLKLGVGVRMSKWDNDNTEFGVDLDGVMSEDYTAGILSAKFLHRF